MQIEKPCQTDDDELAEKKIEFPRSKEERRLQAFTSWKLPDFEKEPVVALPYDLCPTFIEAVPAGQDDSYLVKLGNILHAKKEVAITNAQVSLSGMGGVGKSSLALRYAHLAHQHHVYDLILWWDAETKNTLIQQYRQFLNTNGRSGSNLDTEADVVSSLSNYIKDKDYQKYLFIYDNVPYQKGFIDLFPQGSGHCLMTSRCRKGWIHALLLDVFSREESIDYLMKTSGIENTPKNRDLAGEIAEEVGDLPLALEHVGSYLQAVHTNPTTYSFLSYLKKFKTERDTLEGYDFESVESDEEVLEFADAVAPDKSKQTVATTWRITMEQLTGKTDPYKCRELMMYCAYLSPHNIPIDLLKTGVKKADKKVETGLSLLSDYSLLKRTDETVSVHRLIQWVIRHSPTTIIDRSFFDNKMPEMILNYVQRSFSTAVPHEKICEHAENIIQHSVALIKNAETRYPSYRPPDDFLILGKIMSLTLFQSPDHQDPEKTKSLEGALEKNIPVFFRNRSLAVEIDKFAENFNGPHPLILSAIGVYYDLIKNHEKAFQYLMKAATKEFSPAQFNLGVKYHHGFGIEQDDGKAFEWWSKAAEQGHSASQNNLGLMYENGRGIVQNDSKAFAWYEKAAEQGCSEAQYNLGKMYRYGRGIEQNDYKAFKWYAKAAEQGDYEAQFNLGQMYKFGRGIDQNDGKAFEWYGKAAEQGDVEAQNNLGWMYEDGHGVDKNAGKAVEWFRKAAEQGYSEAQNNLGVMYENGRGIEQNDGKAVEWYRKSAEQGYSEAQYNLGWMYEDGQGVGQDDDKACEWYRKAAEQGYSEAQFALGRMYDQGQGVDQDVDKAFEWYRKAAEQGDSEAQNNLGLMYENGRGIEKDDAKAVEWYRNAAKQGHANAQFNLGKMYQYGRGIEQNDDKAFAWYRNAAEQGHVGAEMTLGILCCK